MAEFKPISNVPSKIAREENVLYMPYTSSRKLFVKYDPYEATIFSVATMYIMNEPDLCVPLIKSLIFKERRMKMIGFYYQ